MREATIEVLEKGEKVLGSPTIGRYMVREYNDGEETGGGFYKTLEDAKWEDWPTELKEDY